MYLLNTTVQSFKLRAHTMSLITQF